MRAWALLAATTIMPVVAQVLIKIGLRAVGGFTLFDPAQIVRAFLSPFVIAGLACYTLGAFLLMAVLSRYEMSYANLILSLSYVLLLVASVVVFHEHVSTARWIGAGLILVGVVLVAGT